MTPISRLTPITNDDLGEADYIILNAPFIVPAEQRSAFRALIAARFRRHRSPSATPDTERGPVEISDAMVATGAREIVEAAQQVYRARGELVAMRCALGDAAGLCDVVAKVILESGRGRNGRVRKEIVAASEVAKRCGDDIWNMRALIKTGPPK